MSKPGDIEPMSDSQVLDTLMQDIRLLQSRQVALETALGFVLEEYGIPQAEFAKCLTRANAAADQVMARVRDSVMESNTPEGKRIRRCSLTEEQLRRYFDGE